MFRRSKFRVSAAGAAFFASGAIACASDAVNSVQFSDGNVLSIEGIYGSGTNTAFEVVQMGASSYAWEYRWNPGTNVDGWTMLSSVSTLSATYSYYGPPYNEHFVSGLTYGSAASSAYPSLSFGSFNAADVSAANPQGTTWTSSNYGVDQLILTSNPGSVPAMETPLANGSLIGWGTYSADYTVAYAPTLPETAAPISIPTATTMSASTDSDLGNAPAGLSFDGGKIAITHSFNSPRQVTISPAGGIVDVSAGMNFGLGGNHLLTWAGPLNVTNSGTVSILQTGPVSVTAGAALNIAPGASVIVNGGADPFTDSFTPGNHVPIINNGSFTVNIDPTIAGITGAGSVSIGDGSSPALLQLSPGGGASSASSLSIADGASLDITNNIFNINYTGNSPFQTIKGYILNGKINSSLSDAGHTVGYADDGSKVEFRYTVFGDTNLDGTTNFADLLNLSANYASTASTWATGDFNGDGTTNFSDLLLLAANYTASLDGPQAGEVSSSFAADWNLALSEVSSVPEPASLGIIAGTGIILLQRRRKSS